MVDNPDGETRDLTGRVSAGEVPERLGRYRIIRPLGSGAMGVVYLARDETLGRDVAVKTLRDDGSVGAVTQQRFLNEARAVAALGDPNIVAIYDLGVEGDTPFIVMELVPGRSLAEILATRGRLSGREVCTMGIQMARALSRAHRAGIVHRDVKPGNILEADPETWKLADFGVARMPDSSLTHTGVFVGTPAYAAPESLVSGDFAPPCDVFGLGAVLYECLTGTWPQKGKDVVRAVAAYQRAELAPPSQLGAAVSPAVDAALLAAVASSPGARPSALELAEALAAGGPGNREVTPVPSPSPSAVAEVPPTIGVETTAEPAAAAGRGWIGWVVGVAVVLALALWLASRRDGADDAVALLDNLPERPAIAEAPPEPAALIDAAAPELVPPWPDLSSLRADPGPYGNRGDDRVLRDRWRYAQELFERGAYGPAAAVVDDIDYEFPRNPAARDWLRWYDRHADELELQGYVDQLE